MTSGNSDLNSANGNAPQHPALVVSALLVTGFGIGWLAGLSVSPVVSIVVTSVIGVAAALVTALSGLKQVPTSAESVKQQPFRIEVWPLAVLVVAVVIGSWLGILARNNHLFGSAVSSEITKWTKVDVPREAVMERLFGSTPTYSPYTEPYTETLQLEIDRWTSLGIPEEQVVNRLFERHFSASAATQTGNTVTSDPDSRLGTYLFAASSRECTRLLAAANMAAAMNDDELLVDALRNSTVTQLRTLPDLVADPETLKLIVEQVLCADG